MQLSHAPSRVSAVFDDPNLMSCGGLAPVVALADRAGLAGLVSARLTLGGVGGGNAAVKVPALVAGMVTGADSASFTLPAFPSRLTPGRNGRPRAFPWASHPAVTSHARQGGDRSGTPTLWGSRRGCKPKTCGDVRISLPG